MQIFYIKRAKVVLMLLFLSSIAILGWEGIGTIKSKETVKTMEPIYQGINDKKMIALTFNVDWGEDVLTSILNILSQKDVQATFFITGRFASKFPELVKEIHLEGHEIGNHGYSHNHPNSSSREKNREEILKTEKILRDLNIKQAKLYAPPYGECNPDVVKIAYELGYKTIMWTIDTVDWKQGRTPEDIASKVINRAHNGAIVLMHPKPATLEALPLIIEELKGQGFKFKKVSQIIPGAKGQNS